LLLSASRRLLLKFDLDRGKRSLFVLADGAGEVSREQDAHVRFGVGWFDRTRADCEIPDCERLLINIDYNLNSAAGKP
jgi:hypothetical protein